MRKKLLLVPLIFLISLISVYADELFLQNETTENLEDTFIDEVNPDLDNGNDAQMLIGEIANDEQQSFIKFSISQIPDGSTITRAELGLFELVDNTEDANTYDIYEVDNQTWNENEVTFNNQPLILNLINESENPTVGVSDGFILFNVLSWVLNQSGEGLTNVSFNVNKSIDAGGGNDQVRFQAKEISDQTQRPFLNITFTPPINRTNLDVFLSKNPVEILESFTLFANYTNSTDGQPVLNANCFANSSAVGGGQAGFGRGVLGIGGLSTLLNAVHTQVDNIFGSNTLRVDIDNIPLGKESYAINFRFHAHNQTPDDNLRVFATCHPGNLTFSNFTFIDQINATEAVISTSTGNDTIWGFKNVVLLGASVASPNCSIVFESQNTSIDKHWMIADTTTDLNLDNSFTSDDFGLSYTLRPNANERSPFVDAGFGLDVPNETTMTFNSTSGLYFLPDIRHGRPFDFNDTVSCSANNFENATDFVITNVQDNVAPIVQINNIDPLVAVLNVSTVTIQWSVNDPELLTNFINVSFPDGSLLIQTDVKPLILPPSNLSVIGNYTVIAFANDTGGLFTIANATFEVAEIDVTPPVITLVSPSNNTVNNTIPLPIIFTVTDNFPNDIICNLENSTTLFDSGTFTQAVESTLLLAQGEIALKQIFPNLELTCFDNSPQNNSATLNLNYSLDTIPPIIVPALPSNQSRFNNDIVTSIAINANCTDVPVFRFNMTIRNTTDEIIASFENRVSVDNVITIDELLNIQNLAEGNYSIDYLCSDPHTKKDISNYLITKKNDENKIKWETPSGNEYELKYNDKGISLLDYGSKKHTDNDRYYFWYILNASEDGTKRTFTFELENRKFSVDYLPLSEFKAHFIMADNWMDFEFNDPDAEYFIELNQNNNYEISITTKKTTLNFSSTGELNIALLETQFEIFFIEQIEDLFKVTVCKTDIGSVLLLILFFLLSLFFIWLGLSANIGFIGFFGAIMMMVLSWYIAACIAIFAMIMALLSLVLIVFFVIRFIGFKNAPYQP